MPLIYICILLASTVLCPFDLAKAAPTGSRFPMSACVNTRRSSNYGYIILLYYPASVRLSYAVRCPRLPLPSRTLRSPTIILPRQTHIPSRPSILPIPTPTITMPASPRALIVPPRKPTSAMMMMMKIPIPIPHSTPRLLLLLRTREQGPGSAKDASQDAIRSGASVLWREYAVAVAGRTSRWPTARESYVTLFLLFLVVLIQV